MNKTNKDNINDKKAKNDLKTSIEHEIKDTSSKKKVDVVNSHLNDTSYVSSYSNNKLSKRRRKKNINNDMITKNYDLNLFEVIIIIFITGILVSVASGLIVYNYYDKLSNNDSYSPSKDKLSTDNPLETLKNNYKYIVNNYVGEVDKDALVEAAIEAMYKELGDTYSYYMDEDATNDLQEQISGQYEGFGIEILTSYNGESYMSIVNRVFDDSPAKEAGIVPGDILLELDGISLSDKDPDYLPNIVKYGDKATHTLKILRDKDEKTLTLTRKKVYINSVSGEVIDGVGYISLDGFSETTVEQVKRYLDEFDSSVTSLVIDVRNNPGGSLDVVYELSDMFIEKGKNIYQYKDKNSKIEVYKAIQPIYREFDKIAVLVNENSASASEVLALALRESANAKVVGVKSFGKGTIQETQRLTNGKMTKITIAYWLGPNGTSINNAGIIPDVVVEDVGKQLNEAIKVVK